ncbi:MAG: 4Fe-4S binding protein [Bacteroidetes bacterium]|nr:4Fe-4S binding protein [Bacteroidota bacterium]
MSKPSKKINFYRTSLQYLIILLLGYMVVRAWIDKSYLPDYEAYCPVGGMQAFSGYLVNSSLACTMTTLQIAMGFALIIAVILVSKLFCSFICPIGTFTEWLGRIGSKRKWMFTPKAWLDKGLRIFKYGLLFITFYFTVEAGELFCRKFDPYYAVFTGFGGDVAVLYALLALLVTILGSLFIRQFWCKYLCPLGAATNLVAYTIYFAAITVVYLILVFPAGLSISWTWYLGTLCLAGFLLEILKPETTIFPLIKITRSEPLCTHCKICDKVCPYALNISTADKVSHIDCHLCGDCVTRCPEKGALTYNRRKLQWLPPAVVVFMVACGFVWSSFNEVPTIDIKFGTPEQMAKASFYEQKGLLSIKCYGSSMAFANQVKEIPGVLGVQTFVKHHTAKIFFNPSVINPQGIKAALYTPVKEIIALPGPEVNQLFVLDCGIDHFFDPNDAFLLAEMFKRQPGIYSFETHFGEPVKTIIYYDENKLKPARIKSIIETREFELIDNEQKTTAKPGFSIAWMNESSITVNRKDFLKGMFTPYDHRFNEFEKKDTLHLGIYEIPFTECLYPDKKDSVPYLRNHLMADKGVVRFQTSWKEESPVLLIYFDPGKTTKQAIYLSLTRPKLHIQYKSGETEDIVNPFTFPALNNK